MAPTTGTTGVPTHTAGHDRAHHHPVRRPPRRRTGTTEEAHRASRAHEDTAPAVSRPVARRAKPGPAPDALGRADDAARSACRACCSSTATRITCSARSPTARSGRPASSVRAPPSIVKGGPVIDAGPGQPRSASPEAPAPSRSPSTTARTRVWTPQILDVLQPPSRARDVLRRRHRGRRPSRRWPGGSSLTATKSASHTFTHADLATVARLAALARAAREPARSWPAPPESATSLLRPPYSSEPAALNDARLERDRGQPARPAT